MVVKYFKDLPFRIHLSFDLWSSPNHRSFLGVVAHWTTDQGVLRSSTIAFRRFLGPHSGVNIASTLYEILERYEISEKLGHITTDNAANNDQALVELAILLGNKGIMFNPESSRVRCFGHIINLVVKGFLWGLDWQAFENNIDMSTEEEERSLKSWRKKGPIGKLHNIGVWILRTPQRRDRFTEKVRLTRGVNYKGPLLPIVGNVTRWSSDADALDRAFELQDILNEFVGIAVTEERQAKSRRTTNRDTTIENDRYWNSPELVTLDELTSEDWQDLAIILQILKPFRRLTLELQGTGSLRNHANGYLARILPGMDDLLASLEEARPKYADSSVYSIHILTSINHAWSILDK